MQVAQEHAADTVLDLGPWHQEQSSAFVGVIPSPQPTTSARRPEPLVPPEPGFSVGRRALSLSKRSGVASLEAGLANPRFWLAAVAANIAMWWVALNIA